MSTDTAPIMDPQFAALLQTCEVQANISFEHKDPADAPAAANGVAVADDHHYRPLALDDRLLIDGPTFARLLSISLTALWRLTLTGAIPRPVRLGWQLRWSRREIDDWHEAGQPDAATWERMKDSCGRNGGGK